MSTPSELRKPATSAEPLLRVREAEKRFGAVVALDGVSLDLYRGEVLAVLGDNGAGKSTLMKCISGSQRLDGGAIELEGRPLSLRSPHDARRHGVETVYQDLALFDNLDVEANFFACSSGSRSRSPACRRRSACCREVSGRRSRWCEP